jgi:hypothetical protein
MKHKYMTISEVKYQTNTENLSNASRYNQDSLWWLQESRTLIFFYLFIYL